MNWKKHRVLLIGGGLALLALIGAVVLLVQYSSRYSETASTLDRAEARLRQLNTRQPYPSPDNVEVLEGNLAVLREELTGLKQRLGEAGIVTERIEPAQFAPLLERTYRRMVARSQSLNVPVPDPGAYGYAVYAQGTLPDPAHVERLVRQAKLQEAIANLLLDANISSIEAMERTPFEEQAEVAEPDPGQGRFQRQQRPARRSPGGRGQDNLPLPEPSDLYETERFKVVFTGREGAVWETLNTLAASPLFIKVVDVAIDNLGENLGQPVDLELLLNEARRTADNRAARPAPEQITSAVLATIPREERIVAGREEVRATLTLDVFLFSPDPVEADEPAAGKGAS